MAKLWRALEETGATLHSYTDPVVKYHAEVSRRRRRAGDRGVVEPDEEVFPKTCDALVVTYDPAVVAGLRRLWTADRERLAMPADISERLIVGPERARRQFTALIEGARTSIRLIDAKLVGSRSRVAAERASARAGLTVELFSSKRLGRPEIARQDHADRRPDRRRRQPGAGGAQPRLPSRGGHRRDRRGGGRRRPSSCSRPCATRRPTAATAAEAHGRSAVLIAVCSERARRRRRPRVVPTRGAVRSTQAGGSARAEAAGPGRRRPRSRQEGTKAQRRSEEGRKRTRWRQTRSRRRTNRIDPAGRCAGPRAEVLLEAASVDALRRRLPPRRRSEVAGGRALRRTDRSKGSTPGSSTATGSASRAISPSRSSTRSSTSSPRTS